MILPLKYQAKNMNTYAKILSRIFFGLREITGKYYKRDIIWCNKCSCYSTGRTVGGGNSSRLSGSRGRCSRECQTHSQPISSMELRRAQQEDLIISILKCKKLMQRMY